MKSGGCLRLGIIALIVALLASIALNVILFRQSQQYYLELNDTRLDPLGLNFFSTDDKQPDQPVTNSITAVFFGDSRAAQWPTPSDITDIEFVNRGIGAQTSAQTLQRFDQHLRPLHPQIVILQIGINDLKTIPLFPDRKEEIIARTKENIRRIVMQSVDLGASVILTTIFPTGDVPLERRFFWSPDVASAVQEVNATIASMSAENVIVLDTYSLLATDGKLRQEYAHDFLHLNASGYQVLNAELSRILNDRYSNQ